jgi:hypothetical protein
VVRVAQRHGPTTHRPLGRGVQVEGGDQVPVACALLLVLVEQLGDRNIDGDAHIGPRLVAATSHAGLDRSARLGGLVVIAEDLSQQVLLVRLDDGSCQRGPANASSAATESQCVTTTNSG